tara:strand:+ start:543 stop:743 length:201 start_codon:yes stop_codon:yes gene_type:complete
MAKKTKVQDIEVVEPIVIEVQKPSKEDEIKFSLMRIQDSLNEKPNPILRNELLKAQTKLQKALKEL